MENPIKDNRIVNDITFAARFLNFLENFYSNVNSLHPLEQEEYEYLCIIAKKLLDYQKSTCTENEQWYFDNLKNIKHNEKFENFLLKLTK